MCTTKGMTKMAASWIFLWFFLIQLINGTAYGQTVTARYDYDSLSLKDLLMVRIASVSKQSEYLFDAPLSASVLTRKDIRKAGSTSIMEAMRLLPGVIVREETKGNYDISLRGMDNVPPNSPFDVSANSTTLVMIDSRPVYSYLHGGTFWETLPIDLNDVEKIEVIRGPAAALYGPNAVDGVINIITRQPVKEGLYAAANTQQGIHHTYINNISAGYRFNKKWGLVLSGNHQGRDRTQLSYFELYRNQWLMDPAYFLNFTGDTVRNVNQRYPDQSLALDKSAGNLFLNYAPSENARFSLNAGAQHSEAQKISSENQITPLSTAISNSKYADLRATVKGLTGQFSYNGGTQSTDQDPGRKYDFSIAGGTIGYSYIRGNLTVKPGLSYTSAVYDDRKYSDLVNKTGIFNGRGQITTRSASIRAEYTLLQQKLRLVAGLATSAPRSSNIFDTYVTKTISYYPTGPNSFTSVAAVPEKDPLLVTAGMFELGYRGRISAEFSLDLELFATHTKNYNTPVNGRPYIQLTGPDTILVIPVKATTLPLRLLQEGLTLSLTYSPDRWQVRPFVTLQHTRISDYAPFINTPDAGTAGAVLNNIYSGIGSEGTLKSTPAVYGGAFINYIPVRALNINVSCYYYSAQEQDHVSNILFNDGKRGIDHINAKFLLNASLSYEPSRGLTFFCSGKNILNDNSREYFRADAVPVMVLGGIRFEFQK